jgi:hypothetical protein
MSVCSPLLAHLEALILTVVALELKEEGKREREEG